MMAFERLLTAETRSRPDLARRFFDAGPRRVRDNLVDIVELATERGELVVANATEAVGDLIGLWQGFERLEHAFGVIAAPAPARIEARVDRCIAMFMRLYAMN
jgi:TetR/AcrR family transcriptional repressor of mexJK operon